LPPPIAAAAWLSGSARQVERQVERQGQGEMEHAYSGDQPEIRQNHCMERRDQA
jgi:hypothetical protein